MVTWARSTSARVARVYHVLDLFGASRKVSRQWEREGFNPASYDIKLSSTDDICSEAGFKHLLTLGLM